MFSLARINVVTFRMFKCAGWDHGDGRGGSNKQLRCKLRICDEPLTLGGPAPPSWTAPASSPA